MHDYSIDSNIRRVTHVVLAVVSLSLPTWVTKFAVQTGMPAWVSFPLSFGATFGLLYFIVDRFAWRWLCTLHGIPDLQGKWEAQGKSSYIDPATQQPVEFSMTVTIRQTFSRIEVFTETKDSTSRSFMASIEIQHAVTLFRYGFENVPKNMSNSELQRHPGMMELRHSSTDVLEGDYFSGKHRLRYGELKMTRISRGNF